MRNLHNFMEKKYGRYSLHLLWEWESLEIRIVIIGTIADLHLDVLIRI